MRQPEGPGKQLSNTFGAECRRRPPMVTRTDIPTYEKYSKSLPQSLEDGRLTSRFSQFSPAWCWGLPLVRSDSGVEIDIVQLVGHIIVCCFHLIFHPLPGMLTHDSEYFFRAFSHQPGNMWRVRACVKLFWRTVPAQRSAFTKRKLCRRSGKLGVWLISLALSWVRPYPQNYHVRGNHGGDALFFRQTHFFSRTKICPARNNGWEIWYDIYIYICMSQ